MSNRKPSGNKLPSKTTKVTLMDLVQMELILPPIFNGLNMKVVVEFDGKTTKLGLRADGVKFDHDWSELKQCSGIAGVVNRLTSEIKENRGKELAVALLGANHEEKVLDAMAQKVLLYQKKGEQIEKLQKEIQERVVTTALETSSKKIALTLCEDLMHILAQIKVDKENFDFALMVTQKGIPLNLAERMTTPGFSMKDKDLLSLYFPSDPRNHLCVTYAEIMQGAIERFIDILVPQNSVFLWYLIKKFIPDQAGSLKEPKVAKFRWRFIPPLNINQLWKHRDKIAYRVMGGDPAYQFEAWNMAFYGAATQVITAPHPVIQDMREYLWGFKPQDVAEIKSRAPEKPLDPAVFKQKFYADFLERLTDVRSDQDMPEQKWPALGVIAADMNDGNWKIDTSKVPKILKRKKELSFQKGTFPVRGKEAKYLLDDIQKTKYASQRGALANYLTNYKGDLQEHVARVLYARLITGLAEVEAEAIDEDAHPDEDDHYEDEE